MQLDVVESSASVRNAYYHVFAESSSLSDVSQADVLDMSLYSTVFLLYRTNKDKIAEECRSTFKMSDAR